MKFSSENNTINGARALDAADPLSSIRSKFQIPLNEQGEECLYFAGHSLGLRPENAKEYICEELDAWGKYGVEGHFYAKHPWLSYHENLTGPMSRIVGAKESEVVVMNTLTVNLHLAMVSFYRPTKKKFKILIEKNSFPSDHYAVSSQARFHGFDPKEAIIELTPEEGKRYIDDDIIEEAIKKHGDELALVMIGQCNYLSGQAFDMKRITELGHNVGAFVGFNLAHGAGNLQLNLHDDNVDFAVWCTYKYLNSGPGSLAGLFVHENHLGKKDIPRFEGWWGHNKKDRFKMEDTFDPIDTVEAWQLSNPPIFQLAAMRASVEIFDEVGMGNLRKRGDQLTDYLQFLLEENCRDIAVVTTPQNLESRAQRGSMLSIKFNQSPEKLLEVFKTKGVIVDFRMPDILRMTPAPLYNNYSDIFQLVSTIKDCI
jgi:kynureninase